MADPIKTNHSDPFERLKVVKKNFLTKTTVGLRLQVPPHLQEAFYYEAGQYLRVKIGDREEDYSITTAPYEDYIGLAAKITSADSFPAKLAEVNEGDLLTVSHPQGRFTVPQRPAEKRTILGFAGGIGITPIISHLKNILHTEPGTRFFLFYGVRNTAEIIFKDELTALQQRYGERFQVFYFYSREQNPDPLFSGRIDEKKVKLIINQILHLDEEDEESTIWDATDKVLICGPGAMIKSIANACYDNGIRKTDIHFELFESFNDDIYELETPLPYLSDIRVEIVHNRRELSAHLPNNDRKLLQQLLDQGIELPYSCKSGICGSCRCRLVKGEVFMTDNDFLTASELKQDLILPCVSIPLSEKLQLNFDTL
ncbi:MAG: hypothetical protein EAS48_03010 [Chryseobacterium sp.]|nr:MAG: hypothetical protein EAS48_03010 [Chryseobacterium sp.]